MCLKLFRFHRSTIIMLVELWRILVLTFHCRLLDISMFEVLSAVVNSFGFALSLKELFINSIVFCRLTIYVSFARFMHNVCVWVICEVGMYVYRFRLLISVY